MELFDKISKGFRDYVSMQPVTLLLLVMGAAVIVLSVMALNSFAAQRRRQSPLSRRIFKTLARVHGLSRSEARLLRLIAHHYEIRDPVTLFVRRSLFENGCASLRLDPAAADSVRRKIYGP